MFRVIFSKNRFSNGFIISQSVPSELQEASGTSKNFTIHDLNLISLYIEQRESLEEENREVHNTNNAIITRLQELETTSTQLHVN